MKELTTVTIAIPAFNEAHNIKHLLEDLLKQVCINFVIDKIIVNSDGSKDNTAEIVKTLTDKRIILIDNKETLGHPARQNEMLRIAKTDIVVLLNADIQISDIYFLEKLIAPCIGNGADLTSCEIIEMHPTNLFENVIYYSMQLKKRIFLKYKDGNNVYTCHGPARALSKRFYTQLEFQPGSGEDAYSYLRCMQLGYKYQYVLDTFVQYRLSDNFRDYRRQNVRYLKSIQLMKSFFGSELIEREYKIPNAHIMSVVLPEGLKNPVYCFLYIWIYGISKITSFIMPTPPNWKTAESSKVVRRNK